MNQGLWMMSGNWKKEENGFSPNAFRKKCNLAYTLILAQKDMYWTSYLQNCKIIPL